jgi:hypothetical protein
VSAIRFAYPGCRTARVRSRSVQDFESLDSDLSQLGWRWGSHRGSGEAIRADLTGGQIGEAAGHKGDRSF